MKALSLSLIPTVALLFSACAAGPVRQGYGGPGYYGHDTVYVEGQDRDHQDRDHRGYNDTQNNSDVSVNRTTVNDRTVNETNVHETNRNTEAHGKAKPATAQKTAKKHVPKDANGQQGDQQQQPH